MIHFVKERIQTVRLAMPYKTIPKRFAIGIVHRVVVVKNSLPWKGSLHSVLSPREIVTGMKFQCPKIRIGQYVQGLIGGTNDTETERPIDSLYLGRSDNGSGHIVFKLDEGSRVGQ